MTELGKANHKYDGALLSYGAGVNSTAMAIMLINEGWRGPIVFADTGCEHPETYSFIEYFEREWLNPRGFEIIQLKGLPWFRYSKGLSLIEHCEQRQMIPLARRRWCSVEFKVLPINRWAEIVGITTQLVGIAADEAHRTRIKKRPGARTYPLIAGDETHRVWRSKRYGPRTYPLVEGGIDRKQCIQIISEAGLVVPPKSGCWLCPMQRESQWRRLWQDHPALFERAMFLEESVKRDRYVRWRATLDPSGRTTLRQRKFGYDRQLEIAL